ncbi:hypothetical protein [Alteribacter populi]|uniref:hypothetical protein n=1 Tax=Alteribacter populi TaxID=2011011 RepID=UPI001AEF3B3F|nr:hypothetical protein [Alteribacter populi]
MKKSKKFFIPWAFALVLLSACNSAEEEAQLTFEQFIIALDDASISDITDHVTEDFVEREFGVTMDEFESESELIDEQMGEVLAMFNYEIQSFEVNEESEKRIEATYVITITEEEEGTEETEAGSVVLIHSDNDEWLIDIMDD